MPKADADKVIVYNKAGEVIFQKAGLGLQFETPAALNVTIKVNPKVIQASARGYVGLEDKAK